MFCFYVMQNVRKVCIIGMKHHVGGGCSIMYPNEGVRSDSTNTTVIGINDFGLQFYWYQPFKETTISRIAEISHCWNIYCVNLPFFPDLFMQCK